MAVIDVGEERDPLDALADEFLERYRRGETPDVAEYVARLPEQGQELGELLSALLMIENLKPRGDETRPRSGGMVAAGQIPRIERLGDYQIIREVGRGGMGVVYEAEQVSLGRRVALKVLSPNASRTSHQIQRFLREARSAAQLHHTNIVPVFAVGDQSGLYYYAMQFIRGQGLDKVLDEIKRARLPDLQFRRPGDTTTRPRPDEGSVTVLNFGQSSASDARALIEHEPDTDRHAEARESLQSLSGEMDRRYVEGVARLGVQVAQGLEYAHRQGTLHRDIKPSNLLVDLNGNVWIADFGLAKAVEDEDLTQTGDLVGTIRYMSPEQFRGNCDARSDIYALGLTLYEMLALRPAFIASARERLISQMHEQDPPRLRSINRSIPRDLETIAHKAIERDPKHRYASAAEMADDLQRFLEHRPIQARRVWVPERLTRWARRNPGLATLGTVVAALLALTVVVIALADLRLRKEHGRAISNLNRAEFAEAEIERKFIESSLAQARAGRRGGLAGRRFDSLRALQEAAALDEHGQRALQLRSEAVACLALTDIRPGTRWPDPPDGGYRGFDFDPQRELVAWGMPDGSVRLENLSGPSQSRTLHGPAQRPVLLRFSRDGAYLAVKHDNGSHPTLVVWHIATQRRVLDLEDELYGNSLDFHPNGRTVAVGSRDGSISFYDLGSGHKTGQHAPNIVPDAVRFDATGNCLAVISTNSDTAVQIRRVGDGSLIGEWSEPVGPHSLDWHPEGRWIAVGAQNGLIYLLDPMHPERPPITMAGHDGHVVTLAFEPTKGEILASGSWDGSVRLWDIRTHRQLVQTPAVAVRSLRFSGDGKLLGPGNDGANTYVWEVAGNAEFRELEGLGPPFEEGGWSIDCIENGSLLAAAGPAGVFVAPLDGDSVPTRLLDRHTRTVAVARDGTFLLTSGSSGLLRWPIAADSAGQVVIGPPQPLSTLQGLTPERIRLSADGRTLAVVVDEEQGRAAVLDLLDNRKLAEVRGHKNLERLALSPDGRLLATGTWKGEDVKIWNACTGTLERVLPVKGSAEVFFSDDGRFLLVGSGSSYDLWELSKWTIRHSFPRRHADGVPGVAAFRGDGKLCAILATRSLVQLVDPDSGRVLAALESPEPRLLSDIAFTPDGKRLLLAAKGHLLQSWDLTAVGRGLYEIGLGWPTSVNLPPAKTRPERRTIRVEAAAWEEALREADKFTREGRWADAATAYRTAIDAGAVDNDVWPRLALMLRLSGNAEGYREACRRMLASYEGHEPAPKVANNLAWSCVLEPDAVSSYERVIAMATRCVESNPELNRINTLGAVLFRAGRFPEALAELQRSVDEHGAGGTPYDGYLIAMTHFKLGHVEEARGWLARTLKRATIAMRKPDASGPSSWIPELELDLLRGEARSLIGDEPASPGLVPRE